MSGDRAIRTARRIFAIAAIYGVIILLPMYFAEPMTTLTRDIRSSYVLRLD